MVGANSITGTLNYVTDYTGFSGDASDQSGNYLALHIESNDADSITVELIGDPNNKGEIELDSDGIIVLRVDNTSQAIRVKAYINGVVANVHRYSLAGLTLNGE